jgi:AcrR family transcriptional regulator
VTQIEATTGNDGPAVRYIGGRRHWSPRQRELLDELEALFLAEGFRHLTIGDLAERVRCSRRTLYSLAPSREELVLLVIDRMFNHMGVEARARLAGMADPGEAIASYLETGFTWLRPAQQQFMEDLESYYPTKHLWDRHLSIALEVLGQLIEDGIASGHFRNLHPPLVAEILEAAVARIRHPDVLARAGVSYSRAIEEMSDLIRHGLLSDSGAAPKRRK